MLIPGTYRITAEHTGFKRAARNDVRLSVNDSLQAGLALEVGDVTQSIVVTESVEVLQSAGASIRFTVAAMYELPFGRRGQVLRSAPRAVDAAIGGWQVSTIFIYQSGLPLGWGDVVFFGNPDDIAKGPHTVEQWFNVNAGFTRNTATRPASYHYRGWPFRFADVRGPALSNVDLSIDKRWRINERGADVQLRGEALNAFNHALFANPTTDQFNGGFGQITATANYQRQIQVMLRVGF